MSATTEQSVRDRLLAGGFEPFTTPSWLLDLCERTYGDWRFFKAMGPDERGNRDITSNIDLAWMNGVRRVYVHYDYLRREVERHKGSSAHCIESAWSRITYMMDRVEGKE